MTTINSITKGNYFDSRIGGNQSYSMWTEGYDVRIQEDDRREFFYQLRNYDRDVVTAIDPVELHDAHEVSWDELNVNVRKAHFHNLYPEGTESEMNLFVYGEEKGGEINAENEWAEAHKVYSRDITLRLAKELGHFEKVEFLRSVSRWVGTGYKNYIYVVDGKWQVTVSANNYSDGNFYDSYHVEEYAPIVASQKAFGRRVGRLAKAAGVPWNVAVFVGNIADDTEAIAILNAVKASRARVFSDTAYELSCGIGRRVAAIQFVLGDELWGKLSCRGQQQTKTLANYLVGE